MIRDTIMNTLKESHDYKCVSIQCNKLAKLIRDIEESAQLFNFIEIFITTFSNIFDFMQPM